jgi:catechol 2,3-dioxygenase-like lactoylglutathione lyase family enzyme
MRGAFVDLCVADVAASSGFYRSLLGLGVIVDHGWYVELGAGDRVALALVQAGHETVPSAAGRAPSGVLVSFEVDDASEAAEVAGRMGCRFAVELVEELGQRHFMVVDPDGAVVDVIERIPLTAADLRRLARYRHQHLQRTAP